MKGRLKPPPWLGKLFQLRRLAGAVLVLLLLGGTVKVTNRTLEKADEGRPLNPAESALRWFARELPLNPLPVLRALWQGRGLNALAQPLRPADSLELLNARARPIAHRLLYSHFDPAGDSLWVRVHDFQQNHVSQRWRFAYAPLHEEWERWLAEFPPSYRSAHAGDFPKSGLIHPLPLPDGGLIFRLGGFGPTIAVDAAGHRRWTNTRGSHHSFERAPDGTIWTCSVDTAAGRTRWNDALLQLDAETGEVLFHRSLRAIFRANPRHDLSALNQDAWDAYHLNEVQPVPGSSPFWRRGDVFLSLRNINTVLLYRPATDRILWRRSTLTSGQHDVNVLNDSTISIFDNNYVFRNYQTGEGHFRGEASRLLTYNFAADRAAVRFETLFRQYGIATPTQGRARFLPADSILFAEATDRGYWLISNRRTQTTYRLGLAGSDDEHLANLRWGRLLPPAERRDSTAQPVRASAGRR